MAPRLPREPCFGIGTQTNNALPSGANLLTVQGITGYVNTAYGGQPGLVSYFDSGTNLINFDDNSIPVCTEPDVAGLFCPNSTLSLSATVTGYNNAAVLVNFSIANAFDLINANPNATFTAFSNLGGSAGQAGAGTFAWGLPFFYGQNVYFAMENTNPGGTLGPYIAFLSN